MRTQLLCTFVKRPTLNATLEEIMAAYQVVFDKIYVFQNDNDAEDLFCTYNVDAVNLGKFIENTISLHRKKQTNSLYTINSLNEIIKSLNNGILDKKYEIPWQNYQNSILLTNRETGFSHIKIHIYSIVDTKTWKK
jgi:hypothetical protein